MWDGPVVVRPAATKGSTFFVSTECLLQSASQVSPCSRSWPPECAAEPIRRKMSTRCVLDWLPVFGPDPSPPQLHTLPVFWSFQFRFPLCHRYWYFLSPRSWRLIFMFSMSLGISMLLFRCFYAVSGKGPVSLLYWAIQFLSLFFLSFLFSSRSNPGPHWCQMSTLP